MYGSNPRGPVIGPWRAYYVNGNPYTEVANEAEAIAAIEEVWASDPGCPPVSVTPDSDWIDEWPWSSGDATTHARFYNVERFAMYDGCVREYRPQNNYVWRVRDIACPEHTIWYDSEQACLLKSIAQLRSWPLTCDDKCDLRQNPINVVTGDKYEIESDFTLPWITFNRHYHSSHSLSHGRLGPGWTHDFNARLTVHSTDVATLTLPNGNPLVFREGLEAEDGSGWRIVAVGNIYELRKPEQTLRFDNGRLIEIENLDGSRIHLEYDDLGRLVSAYDLHGRRIIFEYGSDSYLSEQQMHAIQLNGAPLVEFAYDQSGRLTLARYPDESTRQYHYEDSNLPNHLTGITDELNNRYSTFAYTADGLAQSSEHSGGVYRGEAAYSPNGTTTFQDANNLVSTYGFTNDSGYRKITGTVDAGGATSVVLNQLSTDFRRRPISRTDKRGISTTYSYLDYYDSGLGLAVRKATTTEGAGTPFARISEEVRDLSHGRMVGRNVESRELTFYRNSHGQVLSTHVRNTVTGEERVTTVEYCDQIDTTGLCPLFGLVKSIDGQRTDANDITTYTYRAADASGCDGLLGTCPYRKGDLWKTTNALSQVTEILKYDGAGRVLSVKDPDGVVTDLEYHPRGWMTARKVRGTNGSSEADDQITAIEYWPTGLVKQVTQPDGSFTAYAYDAAHRLTDIFDGDGNRIHYNLDNAGNRTTEETSGEEGALLRKLSRVYNQLGQMETQEDAYEQPTGFTYDANGNTDTVTDALDRVTDHDYDSLNRLQRTLQDVGGIEAETSFEYDAQDNLSKVTDPKGLDTDYIYNAFGDLLTLSSPDTGTTTYTYDSAGNRKTQTDARNKTTTYVYDALNRLTGVTYPTTALNTAYTYDTTQASCISGETFSKGRLTRMQDGTGTTQYCYDRFGQLVRKVQVTNGKTFTLRYAYTQAGQLSSVTYPDGAMVDYVRNGQGQVTEVGVKPNGGTRHVLLHEATYYPFGPVAEWVYGNGRLMQRSLNQNYQPGFVEDASAGGLSIGYEFNEVGNLAKLRTADQTDPPLRLFGYDDLNRLTEVKDGSNQALLEGYAYDATGNRESATLGGTFVDYTYPTGSHRLSTVGSTARGYDNAGNTTQIGGTERQFLYNDAGRLRQAKTGNFVTMNYAYNGRGEQVVKYLGSAYTYTVYDEAGRWLGEYDSKGDAKQQAIWLDDLPVGLLVGSGTGQKLHYVEPDAIGTPRVVIDPQRDVAVWKWELTGEAFGNTSPHQDPDGDGSQLVFDMRFPGQRYDAASGLNYNVNRDYSPGEGRYVQSDPIGLGGGISTYGYANGAPTGNADPLGLAAVLPAPIPFPGVPAWLGPASGVGLAGYGGWQLGSAIYPHIAIPLGDAIDAVCRDKSCPPCKLVDGTTVAVGTIGYRYDKLPPTTIQHGIAGDHLNLYKANQNPNNCQCFWQPSGTVSPPPQPGWIPIQPFTN
jgi:RHS repeat-associated protein